VSKLDDLQMKSKGKVGIGVSRNGNGWTGTPSAVKAYFCVAHDLINGTKRDARMSASWKRQGKEGRGESQGGGGKTDLLRLKV
jgi:hypothetical protein